MKLSLNWIKDFVEIPDNIELSKLVYDLTMSTVEVEEAVNLASMFDKMAVGAVREINPHPNADKLVVCSVALGETCIADDFGSAAKSDDGCIPDAVDKAKILREIVCGGINLKEGMKVAVARPGAKVRWHGEGELVELGIAKVRGVESYGMICASSEIGLFDLFPYTEDATIVDLSDFDATPGTPLADALGLNDTILTIDNKSLTNRPDLWGHYGIAREIAAIYDLPLKEIPKSSFQTPNSSDGLKITIENPDLCPRYIGVKLDNIAPKPAPFEMQSRLWRVGVRPINAIVDITNYVMLEVGQPTHAFDADHVQGSIIIRRAASNEKLKLLDGKELTLTTDDLVIASESEPIALAGVMGGEKDSILPETQNVILEIANFNALSVRRTAMRFDTRTEAATRFEKGVDPQRCGLALDIALRLFKEYYPNSAITAFFDNYPAPLQCNEVDVSLSWLESRLGRRLESARITSILARLGFEVSINGDNMRVLAPSWRSTGDVSIPDDIMEEIARIYGLENFEPTPIVTAFERAINQPRIDIDRKIREYLAKTCGMSEVSTYPWNSDELLKAIHGDNFDEMLEMASPPSPSERHLRKSLIPGICKAVVDNLRYFDELAIFESAQVFFDKDYTKPYDERESLPLQRRHVAGAFAAPRERYSDIYRRAKGILEAMSRRLHIEPLAFEKPLTGSECAAGTAKPHWADDVVWQNVTSGGSIVGVMGLLSGSATLACGIKNAAVMLFELDIDALTPLPSRQNTYSRIPAFPMTEYDLSLIFDTSVKWDEIYKNALGKPGPDNLLREVSFIDEFRGRQIPDGKKSVTLRLLIGSTSKTPTSEEIESCASSVTKRLRKTLAAETRN